VKTNYNIVFLFIIISGIGFGLIVEEGIAPIWMKNSASGYDSSNYFVNQFEFTSSDLMKFAFAQSDENVVNQTDSENIIGLNATSAVGLNVTSAVGLNATSAAGLNVTSAAGLNVTSAAGLNVTSAAGLNVTSAVPSEETEEKQNWILILIGIAIIAAGVGIAAALSRKKKVTTTKGSTIKKFCRKCGSSLDPKSKFCGKCGVSISPKKNKS